MGVKEEQMKKYKITEAEYQSLPDYVTAHHDAGVRVDDSWFINWRKENPAQKTKADSTFRTLSTGKQVGFERGKPGDEYALRQFDIGEAKRIAEAQEKLNKQNKKKTPAGEITRLGKDVSTLSSTAKRLGELDLDASPIEGQIKAKLDSIATITQGIEAKRFKADKANLLSGKKKLAVKEKRITDLAMQRVEKSLEAGVPLANIRELIQKNWGMTLEEFNTIYKNNR